MFDIVGKRYWFFLVSILIIIPGIISLAVFGLRLSIDFASGTIWEVKFQQAVEPAQVKTFLNENGFPEASVQASGENDVLIRVKELKANSPEKSAAAASLTKEFGQFTELRFESVGPTVSTETGQRAMWAVAAAAGGILVYIWYAFRKVKKPFRYGVCAVVAMLHDALLVVGLFSIFGWLFGIEVDALFVTAILTVIGFSVHDTIVVFDRIRENLAKRTTGSFEETVNHSLWQTLARSVTTSLTVIITLSALLLFGGVTIKTFVLALLVGIVSGTYSSIFNASLMLVVWENHEIAHFFRRLSGRGATNQAAA